MAVVVLFLVLRPGPSDQDTAPRSGATPTQSLGTASGSVEASPSPSAEPKRMQIDVTVRGGKVQGPREFEVSRGQQVHIVIDADVADEVHVHGYDLMVDVQPGPPAELTFKATAPGVFDVELEDAGLLLFQLKVSP
jgi:heme/copper-type cytochrome/quinol oxidase subunit 2